MDEERRQQKELFEFEKPKKSFPRLSDFFHRAELAGKTVLVLTLEKTIFVVIGMMMLMVVVYAIGVERGRSAGKAAGAAAAALPKGPRLRTSGMMPPIPAPQETQGAPTPAAASKTAVTESAAIKIKTIEIERPYTIIAATFSNRDSAGREAGALKKDGFDAGVIPANRYFQVCIGPYAAKESAMSALKKVRQKHGDAYMKTR